MGQPALAATKTEEVIGDQSRRPHRLEAVTTSRACCSMQRRRHADPPSRTRIAPSRET
jgi:hypothetical protein